MGVQVGEMRRGGGGLKKNLKCENDWNSQGFQNRTQDFVTHTWTTEGMEKPLPYMHSTAGLVKEIT